MLSNSLALLFVLRSAKNFDSYSNYFVDCHLDSSETKTLVCDMRKLKKTINNMKFINNGQQNALT